MSSTTPCAFVAKDHRAHGDPIERRWRLVEWVTYQNADNGFCVVRVKARGHCDLVTLVGHAPPLPSAAQIFLDAGCGCLRICAAPADYCSGEAAQRQ